MFDVPCIVWLFNHILFNVEGGEIK